MNVSTQYISSHVVDATPVNYISNHVVDTAPVTTFGVVASIVMWILLVLPTFRSKKPKNDLKIPPGPRGWPIVGILRLRHSHAELATFLTCMAGSFNSLTNYPELVLDKWAKAFGKIYSVWLGNQLFVVVSDPSIAKDLMVTNGNVVSSRKEMYVKSQTVFAGRGITATPYNNRW